MTRWCERERALLSTGLRTLSFVPALSEWHHYRGGLFWLVLLKIFVHLYKGSVPAGDKPEVHIKVSYRAGDTNKPKSWIFSIKMSALRLY